MIRTAIECDRCRRLAPAADGETVRALQRRLRAAGWTSVHSRRRRVDLCPACAGAKEQTDVEPDPLGA